MSVVKLFLILVIVLAQNYAITPPNSRPPTEQLHTQTLPERALLRLGALGKLAINAWAAFQILILVALNPHTPPSLARPIHHHLLPFLPFLPPSAPVASPPTVPFVAGTLLVLAGALLRVHCFHALGPRFTFELAIRPAHALVTRGVYGVVRHPSYTGGFLVVAGWLLCLADLWHWADGACGKEGEGGCRAAVTGAVVGGWVAVMGLVYLLMSERMDNEDKMLEKHFGDEWRAWSRKVPYRLVPGIY